MMQVAGLVNPCRRCSASDCCFWLEHVADRALSQTESGEDAEVTTRGSTEVTARLVEIRGEFPENVNYDYAFV